MPRRGSTASFPPEKTPEYHIHPSDNVFSYFMFIGPLERKKEGTRWTTDVFIGYALVFFTFIFQSLIIWAIFHEIVLGNFAWRDNVIAMDGGLNLVRRVDFQLDPFDPIDLESKACNDGGSLCSLRGGKVSCAPPVVQLSARFDLLDVNNDGIWSREEAKEQREKLKCKFAIDPKEVFEDFRKFLERREDRIWMHPDVKAGKIIHKAYFQYVMGDIIMCGYRNDDMCANLFRNGIFDAPLNHSTSRRVGNTIDSALDYCQELLRPGGLCERDLPSSYSVWKKDSVQQCGAPEYEKYVYQHPAEDDIKSMLTVEYETRAQFERSMTPNFMLFKGCIIFLWLIAVTHELKQIIKRIAWVKHFPDANDVEGDAVEEIEDPTTLDPEEVAYRIKGISQTHRYTVGFIACFRFCLILTFACVGLSFLSRQTDYIDLLLDGVALVFILEIAEIIYLHLLREDIRHQTEAVAPMTVKMMGSDYLNRRPALKDSMWIITMIIISFLVVLFFYVRISAPVTEALNCACLGVGDNCYEADAFSRAFWDKYWLEDIPAIDSEIDQMKAGASAMALSRVPATVSNTTVSKVFAFAGAPATKSSSARPHMPVQVATSPRPVPLNAAATSNAPVALQSAAKASSGPGPAAVASHPLVLRKRRKARSLVQRSWYSKLQEGFGEA